MDWRQSEICELIRFYEQNVCLWDYHDQDYKNQVIRNKAWAKLANYFDKDVDEVKKKIKHLRNGYLTEKKKVNKMKNRKVPYEPHLYYYNYMRFLDPVQIARIMPEIEKEPQRTARPKTTIISHNGSFESPTRKPSYSSDNIIESLEEEEEQEDHLRLEEEDVEEEINNIDSMRSAFKVYPKQPHSAQLKQVQRIPTSNKAINTSQQSSIAARPMPSKEDTFCAMICSELRLLKSEETYDSVTAEIFIALKNAKAADRKLFTNS
ncbi:uncharacterized protein [Eurosta solidaginis]|uniref:uncharacterized protein n=1 Tax=Eurosta solidaginis TaxID=178769 RepID=UPI003531302A